ncbi:MAG: peptidylprolyl isomerase [Planctomycetota bacterium]|jgi:predicted metal-dependent hydrolase|nr:peptidylprolyl isomerase [Planctomycetota bacterium]
MRLILTTLLIAGHLPAQTPPADAASEKPPRSGYRKLAYPGDKGRVVARVDGNDITLENVIAHISKRHAPDMDNFLRTPAGNLYFDHPEPAHWIRYYADVVALREESRYRKVPASTIEKALSESLKNAFQKNLDWLAKGRERLNQTWEPTQDSINILLDKFQREHGLKTEAQGYLNAMIGSDFTEKQAHRYHSNNARIFGGRVTFAHIMIESRDRFTLALLEGKSRESALKRIEDVRSRLKKDGSNFEEIARAYSQDLKTAPRGGVLRGASRFDPMLPAALCRAAWNLQDGSWTGPLESPYGLHFVKRISLSQQQFILFTPAALPTIRETMRKHQQEDFLYEVRKKRRVELLY